MHKPFASFAIAWIDVVVVPVLLCIKIKLNLFEVIPCIAFCYLIICEKIFCNIREFFLRSLSSRVE